MLSVGDFRFQQKCEERIKKMMTLDTTVLFVSHSIEQVKMICKTAACIESGHLKMYGDVHEICDLYQQS